MNRIYKIVWCNVRNTYVVASELASRKKSKSSKSIITISAKKRSALLAMLLGASLAPGLLYAETTLSSEEILETNLVAEQQVEQKTDEKMGSEEKSEEDKADLFTVNSLVVDSSLFQENSPITPFSTPVLNDTYIQIGKDAFAQSAVNARAIAIGSESKATGENSIAIGNNSKATGTGSMAIGTGTEASASNSIAIGTGSVSKTTNTVSFGNDTLKRKLENIAAAELTKDSYQAVAGYQLYTTIDAINNAIGREAMLVRINDEGSVSFGIEFNKAFETSQKISSVYEGFAFLTERMNGLGSPLVKLDNNQLVFDTVLASGANIFNVAKRNEEGGIVSTRKITGVSNGLVNADSTDAINGSQLHETNERVTENEGKITMIEGDITNITGEITEIGDTISNIDGRVTVNEGKITTIKENITNITSGKAGLFQLSGDDSELVIDNDLASKAKVLNLANGTETRKITGVTDGVLDVDSTDAINGSQLHATNLMVEDNTKNILENTTNIANNTQNITNLENKTGESLKGISEAFGGTAVFDADGQLTGVEYQGALNSEGSLDSVYKGFEYVGGQLDATNLVVEGNTKNILENTTNIANNTQNITNLENRTGESLKGISEAFGGTAVFDAEGKLTGVDYQGALRADSTISNVYDGFAYVGDKLNNITAGTAGLLKLNEDGTKLIIDNAIAKDALILDITGKDGDRTLTGVANGIELNDAVNVAQLKASTKLLGGGADIDDKGQIIAPKYDLADGEFNDVGSALENIDGRVTNVDKRVTNIDARVTENTTTINKIEGDITNITNGTEGLVQLSKDAEGNVNGIVFNNNLAEDFDFNVAGKTGERKITGVKEGDVHAKSTDAINGSQLNATNQSIVDSLGGKAELNPDGTIKGPTYHLTDNSEHNNVGDAITNIDGRVTKNTTTINNIEENITNITGGKAGLVQLSKDEKTIVLDNTLAKNADVFDISGVEDTRTLTGLSEGLIADNSTDAVNGSQLHATNLAVEDNTKNILENTTNIANNTKNIINLENKTGESLKGISEAFGGTAVFDAEGKLTGVDYQGALNSTESLDSVYKGFEYVGSQLTNVTEGKAGLLQLNENGTELVIDNDLASKAKVLNLANGADTRKITGVSDGLVNLESTDAINGSQLYVTNKSIADSLGGGAQLNPDGTIKEPEYEFKSGIKHTNVGSALYDLDDRVSSINNGTGGLMILQGGQIRVNNSLAGTTYNIFNIEDSEGNARTLTGVKEGKISSDSKDAINGSQLHDTNENVANNTSNIGSIAGSLGGNAGIDKDGNFKNPEYVFKDGTTHTDVGSALGDLDGRVTDNSTQIKNIGDKVTNIENNVGGITNGTAGLIQIGKDKAGNTAIVVDNTLGNAKDAGSFDISNGEKDRTLTGVADGAVNKESSDAINGSQLYGSMDSLANILGKEVTVDDKGYVSIPDSTFNLGQDDLTISGALHHLNNQLTSVTANGGGLFSLDREHNQIILTQNNDIKADTKVNFGDRVITGVKDGKIEKGSLEAVNGGQLWETNQKVESNTQQINHINNTLNHYNTRINNIERKVQENRKVASAGISSAMAMSSIPYIESTKYSFGMGAATYDGQSAISMGLTYKTGENSRIKIQGSYDSQNKVGLGIGFAYGF
ncbi:ESPR-type extended signal peptide-containing protein [Ignatzschineria sp. LJL83]